ncbi:MAG: peptidylprolyl isomerase [Nitrospinaceae bacterium]|nr:peptidylprolyl isomerase [Nitrospinaceae bacterium]
MQMRFILTLIILSLISPSVLPGIIQAQTRPNSKLKIEIPKLVARVNGVDIESKYIEFRLSQIEKLALKTAKRPLTVKEKSSIVKGLIEKEVVRELVNQQGKKENLKIEPELIEKELKTLRSLYASEEEFNNAMKSRNINLEEIKKAIQIDINKNHLLNAEIKGKINPPSDEEVKKFYEDNKSRFQRPEAYHTRHILAAYFPPEAVRNQTIKELKKNKDYFARIAEEKIDKVIEELKQGADFEKLAKNLSDDESSRENGGDLDFNYKGSFETSFNEAIEKLNPGETSGKIKTRFGFHVIQLVEKRPSEMAPFTEMKPEIQKYLFIKEAKKKVAIFIEKLKQTADIQTFF